MLPEIISTFFIASLGKTERGGGGGGLERGRGKIQMD